MSSLSLELPVEISEKLNFFADKTGQSISYYMVEALKAYIEDLEDIYNADLAYEEWQKNGKQTLSHEELVKELGLDN